MSDTERLNYITFGERRFLEMKRTLMLLAEHGNEEAKAALALDKEILTRSGARSPCPQTLRAASCDAGRVGRT
jgi:hypothetical protein